MCNINVTLDQPQISGKIINVDKQRQYNTKALFQEICEKNLNAVCRKSAFPVLFKIYLVWVLFYGDLTTWKEHFKILI